MVGVRTFKEEIHGVTPMWDEPECVECGRYIDGGTVHVYDKDNDEYICGVCAYKLDVLDLARLCNKSVEDILEELGLTA